MDHPIFTESVFLTMSKQLNAVPYLCGVHEPSRLPLEATVACQPCLLIDSQFSVCTSLTPRSMTMVFGLGARLLMHMHTRLQNGVLRNGQQPGCAVNIFIDQGKI